MKNLLPRPSGTGIQPPRRGDPFWWLRDRDTLVQRFVLSQVIGEPKCKQRPGPPVPGPRR